MIPPSPDPVEPPLPALDEPERRLLLDAAEDAIGARLRGLPAPALPHEAEVSSALREPRASFVTLRRGGRLLGCIGSLEPHQPLIEDVAANAVAAAFRDPRLPAVTTDDFEHMEIKISVLGDLAPLPARSPDELRRRVVAGVDGLVISSIQGRGTFLPSVWEQLPETEDFLAALWQKAGLRPGSWPRDLVVQRYRTAEFGRDAPRRLVEHPARPA